MTPTRVLVALVILSGCGSSDTSSPDVNAFAQEVSSASAALDSYQAATRTMTTAADCGAAVGAYGTPMQNHLNSMQGAAGPMDQQMRNRGEPSHADLACGVNAMDNELRHHLQVACRAADMGANRTEAGRHVAVMADGLHYLQMRIAEMNLGMGPYDGGFYLQDGGVMGWDDHPAGCGGMAAPDGGMPHDAGPGPYDGGMGPYDGGMGPYDGGMGAGGMR